jgi:hypothetical protein
MLMTPPRPRTRSNLKFGHKKGPAIHGSSRNQMEHPLKTLLYELFLEPVLRLLTWPTMLRAKSPAMKPSNTQQNEIPPTAIRLTRLKLNGGVGGMTSILFTVQVTARPENVGDGNNEHTTLRKRLPQTAHCLTIVAKAPQWQRRFASLPAQSTDRSVVRAINSKALASQTAGGIFVEARRS